MKIGNLKGHPPTLGPEIGIMNVLDVVFLGSTPSVGMLPLRASCQQRLQRDRPPKCWIRTSVACHQLLLGHPLLAALKIMENI